MAVFSRNDKTSDTNFSGKEVTKISAGTSVEGTFKVEGNLEIDGKLNGNVFCNSEVLISQTGVTEGLIVARKITVKGKHEGKLEADYIELTDNCVVRGEIHSNRIMLKEGVMFEGMSKHKEVFLPEKNIALGIEEKKEKK